MSKIVVALGGNAILTNNPSAIAQQEMIYQTCQSLMPLLREGHQLIVTHGNGPQIGNLLLQQEEKNSERNPAMPIDTCVAMTQGSIGYWIQQAFQKLLQVEKLNVGVVSVITQVEVLKNDNAFSDLSKPIGPFLTSEEVVVKSDNKTYKEDAGRGWRQVVASPKPVNIIEYPIIQQLIELGNLVIAAGGGGIPVVKTDEGYQGIEAVIDKDFSAAKLAELVGADKLIILTGVPNVYVNYNQPNQEKLERLSLNELTRWIAENQFDEGSMLPKVKAASQFVMKTQKEAVITSLENVTNFLTTGAGTVIHS